MSIHCLLCRGKEFIHSASFRGTTEACKQQRYTYARCVQCGSLVNITSHQADYTRYGATKEVSSLKARRFAAFLKQLRIPPRASILDYGCANGSLVRALRRFGYRHSEGYEPFHETYSKTLDGGKRYNIIYLTHVFEHLPDYRLFFRHLRQATKEGSLIITIHPSSTRFASLNPRDPLQCWTVHAPFHVVIPSDKAVVSLFRKNGFTLKRHFPYDIQRSGIKDNNRVSALLFSKLGGTRDALLSASFQRKVQILLKNPLKSLDALFFRTKDHLVSTMVFERVQ